MCRPTVCNHCGKTTWAGCGKHVEQVFATVPLDKRCACGEQQPVPGRPASGGIRARLRAWMS